jgi:hypothetical protein
MPGVTIKGVKSAGIPLTLPKDVITPFASTNQPREPCTFQMFTCLEHFPAHKHILQGGHS